VALSRCRDSWARHGVLGTVTRSSPDFARDVAFQKIHNRIEGVRAPVQKLGVKETVDEPRGIPVRVRR
jgi:hypothetical protein